MKAIVKLIAIFCCLAVSVQAEDFELGALTLEDPYIRAMPASAKVSSGYMKIHNHGETADTLLAAASPNAARIEIHEMKMEDNVMRMRPLPQGLELPAGEVVPLEKGGDHLMIFDPNKELVKGETFPLSLEFAKAGVIDLLVEIRDVASNNKVPETDEHHHTHAN